MTDTTPPAVTAVSAAGAAERFADAWRDGDTTDKRTVTYRALGRDSKPATLTEPQLRTVLDRLRRLEDERDGDTRAVLDLGATIDTEDPFGDVIPFAVHDSAGALHERFRDRIAELAARDDPAYGVCECGCHQGKPECGCPGDCLKRAARGIRRGVAT